MVFPQPFSTVGPALASYNFADIISGTGYFNLYLGKTQDKNVISNLSFYSHTIFTTANNATTTLTKVIDDDFDITIQKTITFKGIAILNLPTKFRFGNGAYAGSGYHKVILKKADVAIASVTLATTSGNSVTTYKMNAVDLTMPLTTFKRGEVLRVTIEGWVKINTAGGSGCDVAYAHDPKNRLTDWDASTPSTLTLFLPTRLDI